MKILITGGNGYIGRSLYDNLSDEFDVIKINRSDFDLRDISSMFKFFEDKYFDVIINCAISGGSRLKNDGWDVLVNNVGIFYNLIHCTEHFGKLINFGSGTSRYDFLSPHGLSKLVIEKTILTYPKFYNINIFAVFDENEISTRFIKANIINYIGRKPMVIFNNKKMDFFYMKDLVSVVNFFIKNDNIKSMDCTYSETKNLLDVAHIINNLDDHQVDIIVNDSDVINYYGSYTDIGLRYIGLEQGIKNMYYSLKYEN
jgi:nucleoside-diphosphate-sugar epimerase